MGESGYNLASETGVPSPLLLYNWKNSGNSLEKLQEILGELRMKPAVYMQDFRDQDEELFFSSMKDRILQLAPGPWYRTLVSILASVVNGLIAIVTAMIVDLSETKRLHCKGERWVEKQEKKKKKDLASDKMAKGGAH